MTKKLLTTISLCAIFINLVVLPTADATANPAVLITEVQTGFIDSQGTEFPKQEFIELTNISNAAVDMSGWKLEYLSAANDGTGAPTQTIDTISGQISAGGHGIWEHEGYYPISPDSIFGFGDISASGFLAKSGGHVRLMNGATMVDCVAWGSAVTISGCDKVSSAAPAGYTLQRKLTSGTYDKSLGVANLTPATPQGNNIYSPTVVAPPVLPPTNPTPTTSQPTCDGIQLSEVLANPTGDDAAGEFIELYNPSEQTQSLYGCQLKLSNGKDYAFPDGTALAGHTYSAYMYVTTGLQLGNSGTSVTLVTVSAEFTTTYPTVGDDESWSLINGAWYITKTPTPNAANLFASAATTGDEELSTEACPIGKYRNPETNRCKNIEETGIAIVACAADQERNPATNRCRKITTTTAQLTCPAGQERNSATNRCRKIEAATTTKTCPAGQERNAETNRCRKIVTKPGGKVLATSTLGKHVYHLAILAVVLTAIAGFGIYEYRHDLINIWRRFRLRVVWGRDEA